MQPNDVRRDSGRLALSILVVVLANAGVVAGKLPNGIRLPATCSEGGWGPVRSTWYSEPRIPMAICTPRRLRPHERRAEFTLGAPPAADAVLCFEGQDAVKDLPPVSTS